MTNKIIGTPEFVEKIEQVFDQSKDSPIDIHWKEVSSTWVEISCSTEQVNLLLTSLNELKKGGTQLTGKTTRGQVWFLVQEVISIEAFGNDVETMINKQRVLLEKKLYEYESELASEGFIRIGKSVLINTNRIESVASAYNGKLLLYLDNNQKVYVNRSYSKHFKEILAKKRG